MLHSITWMQFITCILILAIIYYAGIITLFFRKEALAFFRKHKKTTLLAGTLTGFTLAQAQDGNQGISQANTLMRGYFDTGSQLMYAVGAVIALVGAIRVYHLWNEGSGHDRAYAAAAGWFGSCVFLVVVTSVIRSFFGL